MAIDKRFGVEYYSDTVGNGTHWFETADDRDVWLHTCNVDEFYLKEKKLAKFNLGDLVFLREDPSMRYCIEKANEEEDLYSANIDSIYPENRYEFYGSELVLQRSALMPLNDKLEVMILLDTVQDIDGNQYSGVVFEAGECYEFEGSGQFATPADVFTYLQGRFKDEC